MLFKDRFNKTKGRVQSFYKNTIILKTVSRKCSMLLVCCDHCNCCQGTLLFITFDSMKEEMRPWRAGAHQTVPIVAVVAILEYCNVSHLWGGQMITVLYLLFQILTNNMYNRKMEVSVWRAGCWWLTDAVSAAQHNCNPIFEQIKLNK